jgi:hypothetical protein
LSFALAHFPYHDGWLFYDEKLRHDDLWMNDSLPFRHDLTLFDVLIWSLLSLLEYSTLCILEFWSWLLYIFTLAFLVLFSWRLAFFPCNSRFLIYTQAFCSCFFFFKHLCFHDSRRTRIRMKCICMRMAFSFSRVFLTDRHIYTWEFLSLAQEHALWHKGISYRKTYS